MSLLDNAIRRRGDRFWDELVKDRPVVAAQLRQVLIKAGDLESANREVVVHLGDGLAGIAKSIMQPAAIDLDALDAAALRAEVMRQREEIQTLQRAASGLPPVKPKEPELPPAGPEQPASECLDCLRLGHPGRLIPRLGRCSFCGQLAGDNEAGKFTVDVQRAAERGRVPCADAICVTAEPGGGWRPVRSLTVASIHEAVQDDGRGPFD